MTATVSFGKMCVEKPFPKPCTSPAIRCLFAASDRRETKKMVEEMLQDESHRLRTFWNFDSESAGNNDHIAGKSDAEIPMPNNQRFVNWQRQDRKAVPHFYSRPFHRHHSELRSNEWNPISQNALKKSDQSSPLPLTSRNENLIKHRPRKRGPNKSTPIFASPPRISSESVNPSLVRFVTALQAPLPALTSQSSIVDENKPITESQSNHRIHSLSFIDPPKKQAFRQLFEEKSSRKRNYSSTTTKQPKITGKYLFNYAIL